MVIQQNMSISYLLMTLLIYLPCIQTNLGIVTARQYPTAAYKCVRQKGYSSSYVKVQGQRDGFDQSDLQNVQNSLSSGLNTSLLILPCRGNSFTLQLSKIQIQFKNSVFKHIALAADEGLTKQCKWSANTPEQNCEYMRKLAFGLRNLGYNVEMALGSVTWEGFYEGYCKDLQQAADLVWMQFDSQPNYNGYRKMGQWSKPAMKIFSDNLIVCGARFLESYYI